MKKALFLYETYKSYLEDRIRSEPRGGRGFRQKLARAIGCQPAYLSLVLRGDRDLSVDQTVALADFLGLDHDESDFLLNLVELSRAGTASSRRYFQARLKEKRERFTQNKDRVRIDTELSDADKALYYSDVVYSAAHIAVTVPEYQSLPALSERLGVSQARLKEVVRFLVSKGLVENKDGRLLPGGRYLFVDKSSPFVNSYHRLWRAKAVDRASERREEDYHFTMVVSLSEKDALLIRQKLAQTIEELAQIIKASPEEKLMAFTLDFFEA